MHTSPGCSLPAVTTHRFGDAFRRWRRRPAIYKPGTWPLLLGLLRLVARLLARARCCRLPPRLRQRRLPDRLLQLPLRRRGLRLLLLLQLARRLDRIYRLLQLALLLGAPLLVVAGDGFLGSRQQGGTQRRREAGSRALRLPQVRLVGPLPISQPVLQLRHQLRLLLCRLGSRRGCLARGGVGLLQTLLRESGRWRLLLPLLLLRVWPLRSRWLLGLLRLLLLLLLLALRPRRLRLLRGGRLPRWRWLWRRRRHGSSAAALLRGHQALRLSHRPKLLELLLQCGVAGAVQRVRGRSVAVQRSTALPPAAVVRRLAARPASGLLQALPAPGRQAPGLVLTCVSWNSRCSFSKRARSSAARASKGARSSARRPAHACATMAVICAAFSALSIILYSLRRAHGEGGHGRRAIKGGAQAAWGCCRLL